MANWCVHILDKAILYAVTHGMSDEDFDGWQDLDPETRHSAVRQILHHNGVGQIVFRSSFARAIWGESEIDSYPIGELPGGGFSPVKKKIPAFDYHRMAMVVRGDAADWLDYLRKNMPQA